VRRPLEPVEDGVEPGGESFAPIVGPDVLAEDKQRREAIGWPVT
jgi:hypothetical protein